MIRFSFTDKIELLSLKIHDRYFSILQMFLATFHEFLMCYWIGTFVINCEKDFNDWSTKKSIRPEYFLIWELFGCYLSSSS